MLSRTPSTPKLGNVGTTLYYTDPVEAEPTGNTDSLRELCADILAAKSICLLILGGNPVYDAPHDFDFASKLLKVSPQHSSEPVLRRNFLLQQMACFRIALSGDLERCARLRRHRKHHPAADRTALLHTFGARCCCRIQRQTGDACLRCGARLLDGSFRASGIFHRTSGWRKWLNDGVIPGTKFAPITPELKLNAASFPVFKPAPADQIEFHLSARPHRLRRPLANNGWLQELPKPL